MSHRSVNVLTALEGAATGLAIMSAGRFGFVVVLTLTTFFMFHLAALTRNRVLTCIVFAACVAVPFAVWYGGMMVDWKVRADGRVWVLLPAAAKACASMFVLTGAVAGITAFLVGRFKPATG